METQEREKGSKGLLTALVGGSVVLLGSSLVGGFLAFRLAKSSNRLRACFKLLEDAEKKGMTSSEIRPAIWPVAYLAFGYGTAVFVSSSALSAVWVCHYLNIRTGKDLIDQMHFIVPELYQNLETQFSPSIDKFSITMKSHLSPVVENINSSESIDNLKTVLGTRDSSEADKELLFDLENAQSYDEAMQILEKHGKDST